MDKNDILIWIYRRLNKLHVQHEKTSAEAESYAGIMIMHHAGRKLTPLQHGKVQLYNSNVNQLADIHEEIQCLTAIKENFERKS